jgi:hypothetical protein
MRYWLLQARGRWEFWRICGLDIWMDTGWGIEVDVDVGGWVKRWRWRYELDFQANSGSYLTHLIFWSDGERKEVRARGELCVCVIWIIQIPLKNNWDVLNAGLC